MKTLFYYLYQMKYVLFLPVALLVLMSCNHSNKKLNKRISHSDSLAINYFKGDGTMDTVVAVRIIRDSSKMQQLTNLITESAAETKAPCGYDGSLHFFKMNQVVEDIYFRMNDENCMYFFFKEQGKNSAVELTKEAKELIISFR
ncbi:hypothetical protein BH11BAC3_BH11BAC3_43300 [soil metagenome]